VAGYKMSLINAGLNPEEDHLIAQQRLEAEQREKTAWDQEAA
jgi:hypothetical protein